MRTGCVRRIGRNAHHLRPCVRTPVFRASTSSGVHCCDTAGLTPRERTSWWFWFAVGVGDDAVVALALARVLEEPAEAVGDAFVGSTGVEGSEAPAGVEEKVGEAVGAVSC